MKKLFFFFLFTLLVSLSLCPALSEDGDIWYSYLYLRQEELDSYSLGVPRGTVYDVYAAPFPDAFRGAGGRAKVSVKESFTLLGTADEGKWSMIEYSVSGGAKRIGWAQLPPVPAVYDGWDDFPSEEALPCVLKRDAVLTDDPRGERRTVLALSAGDRVKALGALDDLWAYVQADVSGQTAWLFIPLDALEPETLWSVDEMGVLTFRKDVTRIGSSFIRWEAAGDEDDGKRIMAPLAKDEVALRGLVFGENIPTSVKAVEFPPSLRTLGIEALVYGQYDYIRLDGDPMTGSGALYALTADRMILSSSFTGNVLRCDHVAVGAWEAEDGNPVYMSADGVLFSADGKKLLSYPNGSLREHYTVPAGTEEICALAFDDDMMNIPLKTVSLPIGLKRIGEYAFSGCGRLISLAVPLTVSDLDETAFAFCVSLERLSLPPGLKATFNENWVHMGDFTHYNGDNGSTWTSRPGWEY
ncbi:MAG: leucine-rich repeat protein [Clostridia bacterium]|nr:leucine-rich repeat protein [Clostridia bacterium]